MSPIYEAIGRAVVWFVRYRYGKQIRIGIVAVVTAVLLGGYLASSRKMEEG
jgi:hypothetical protein